MLNAKEYPLVLVTWEDSVQPMASWQWLEDFEPGGIVHIRSVGWLLSDGDVKVLAPNIGGVDSPTDQASGIIHIPARCVVSVEVLAQGIAARSDETAQQAQPERQEPGPKDAP